LLAELVSPTAQASSTEGIAKPKSVETPILPLEKPLEAIFQIFPFQCPITACFNWTDWPTIQRESVEAPATAYQVSLESFD